MFRGEENHKAGACTKTHAKIAEFIQVIIMIADANDESDV